MENINKKKKKKLKLPNKIIAIPNPDKLFHEKWTETRDLLNFPHPFRCVLFGPPNCGKTNIIKNIMIRSDFEEAILIHCDSEHTKEYDDLENIIVLNEIPAPDEWGGIKKTIVILDDLEYKGMDKKQKQNLNRLFGYVSTHKNISVFLTSQDCFNVPSSVRRCANVWILWRSADIDNMANMARKSGISSKDMKKIFNQLMQTSRDSLWIDRTSGSPAALRKNGYDLISKKNSESSKTNRFSEK
jgi:ABC-type cobalamin/Fe3+-siderophores transport system ATPase subunit